MDETGSISETFSEHTLKNSDGRWRNNKMAASVSLRSKLFLNLFKTLIKYPQRYCTYETNTYTWRSHTCGELRSQHIGDEVTLCGWIQYKRFQRFIVLRDAYGLTQLVVDENKAYDLPLESVVQVKGKVAMRPLDQYNKVMSTGEIEVIVDDFKILNSSKPNLPFNISEYDKVREQLRLQYRYLDLRHEELQKNIRTRSEFVMKVREFLNKKHGFVEIETPTLFRRTPGGAHEFVVPSQTPEKYYSLCQSPQQFKQLLMVGGMDRYYQIAKCYRDEGSKPDRQPEFTQIDIELSFTSVKHVQLLIEELLEYCWPKGRFKLGHPFPVLTYKEAMETYGTDKPDIRFDMELKDVTTLVENCGVKVIEKALSCSPIAIVCALTIPQGSVYIKNSKIEEFRNIGKEMFAVEGLLDIQVKANMSWHSFLSKNIPLEVQKNLNECLNAKPEDLILMCAGNKENVLQFLGRLRTETAQFLCSKGINIYSDTEFNFLWITDFPLFFRNESGKLEAAHHPFTAPNPDDEKFIYSAPEKVRGLHYDLVLNGQEIGGGSIRIHNSQLQQYVLQDILEEDTSEIYYLLEALESGCPPHGGIALGLDRIISILCGTKSIRDVIAFPKVADGKDLMSGAPASITEQDKERYHINNHQTDFATNDRMKV